MTETIILFLALLAVLCQVFVVVIVVLRLLAFAGQTWKGRYEQLADALAPLAMPLALAIAIVTFAGSLYFSEVAHFMPCRLCWYQRIALYPIAPILLLATIRRDRRVWPYVLLLAAIDVPISVYHYLVEWYPTLESSSCEPDNPCTAIWFRRFGYITIPFMALTSAVTQIVLMLLVRRTAPAERSPT